MAKPKAHDEVVKRIHFWDNGKEKERFISKEKRKVEP
jgi:hypothetical protein